MLRAEAGSRYVSVCAETRGLWCVSAGVFRVQKRAQANESMCLQRSEREGGHVCAGASRGQRGSLHVTACVCRAHRGSVVL